MEIIDSKDNLKRLIEEYQNLIFSICLKITGDYFAAEDLTQETFITAYQNWDKFNGGSEKAWLCRIAGNKSIDYCRTSARNAVPTEEEEMVHVEPEEKDGPLREVMNKEVMAELRRCCQALSPPYDKVAVLHFLDGKTAKEIAEETGVGLNTVKTQIYRARGLLKKIYRKELLGE